MVDKEGELVVSCHVIMDTLTDEGMTTARANVKVALTSEGRLRDIFHRKIKGIERLLSHYRDVKKRYEHEARNQY